jgi:hypothetical protein
VRQNEAHAQDPQSFLNRLHAEVLQYLWLKTRGRTYDPTQLQCGACTIRARFFRPVWRSGIAIIIIIIIASAARPPTH